MSEDDRLADVARAILDGTPVDWAAVEARAAGQEDALWDLQLIERLARVYRQESPSPGPLDPSQASLAVDGPAQWQHLEIRECLGRGAYGAVYRAWDTRLDRDVALKLLPAPRRSRDRASAIIDEGRRLARVRHPSVVTVYGADWIGDEIGIWMELVRGETLDALLRRGRIFDPTDVVRIGLDLCGAVSAVHAAGLLHGDIKAHNVIRAGDGRVVLVDFGAGRERDDASVDDLKGTPLYLAPEVLRGGPATVQSDLYGLGVLLYHLLTGVYPVSGSTTQEIRAAHVRNDRVSARQARPDLPAALARIVDRATDADPSRRYTAVDALAGDLAALGRRRVWLSMAAGLALVAVGGWWRFRDRGIRPERLLANAKPIALTDFEGNQQGVALSADGSLAAFISDRDGRPDVWFTEIGTGVFQNLTQDAPHDIENQSLRTVRFTRDGEVAFWVRGPDGISIYKAPAVPGGRPELYLPNVSEFDTSRDGGRIVYHEPGEGDPTYVRDAGPGATPTHVFTDSPGRHIHFQLWSPDGRFVYVVRGAITESRFSDADIWRISPNGGVPEQVTYHHAFVSYPAFVDDRTLVYLATEPDGSGPRIYTVDVGAPASERRVPTRMELGDDRYTSLSASADGRRVAVTRATSARSTLWRVPIADGRVEWAAARRIPLRTANGSSPRFGEGYLLYVARGTTDSLWRLQGEDSVELWSAPDARIVGGPALSRDGRMAFSVERLGRTTLYVATAGGTDARAVSASLALRGSPSWTPDGRAILTGAIEGRDPRLFLVPVDGSPVDRFLDDYALDPAVSPSGDVVFSGPDVGVRFPVLAVTRDRQALDLGGLTLNRGSRRLVFARDGRTLVGLQGETNHKNLLSIDLGTGAQRWLSELPQDVVIRDFDISADGSEVVLERVREESDVVLFDLPER